MKKSHFDSFVAHSGFLLSLQIVSTDFFSFLIQIKQCGTIRSEKLDFDRNLFFFGKLAKINECVLLFLHKPR